MDTLSKEVREYFNNIFSRISLGEIVYCTELEKLNSIADSSDTKYENLYAKWEGEPKYTIARLNKRAKQIVLRLSHDKVLGLFGYYGEWKGRKDYPVIEYPENPTSGIYQAPFQLVKGTGEFVGHFVCKRNHNGDLVPLQFIL